MTTLAEAILNQNVPKLSLLLQQRADPNATDEYGYTPLIEAAMVESLDATKILLKAGADPNLKDMTGSTPLHWAVENRNIEIATALLEHGANPQEYTYASEAPLVKAILRKDTALKELLIKHGAELKFSQDFINTKLLGHLFELKGHVDILDSNKQFTEIDYEGFFFEFSIGIIRDALDQYIMNYGAKHMAPHFTELRIISQSLAVAAELVQYQQYRIDTKKYQDKIQLLLANQPLIIPISYEGHAITWIQHYRSLITCDRRKDEHNINGICVFDMTQPGQFTPDLIQYLMYEKKDKSFEEMAKKICQPELQTRLLIEPQSAGNCSWANVEACIPALLYLLRHEPHSNTPRITDYQNDAIKIWRHWREWNKDRTLQFCIQNFKSANEAHKASIAATLGAVFFQKLSHKSKKDVERGIDIMRILKTPGYRYILESYKEIYFKRKKTAAGHNLMKLIALTDF